MRRYILFLIIFMIWESISFSQDFNSLVIVEDSVFLTEAIDLIRSQSGRVDIVVVPNTIIGYLPSNAKKLVGQSGITNILFDEEIETSIFLKQPIAFYQVQRQLFELELKDIPIPFKEMSKDLFYNDWCEDNDAPPLTISRSYLLLEDQGVTAIIVEGGGDHIYD
ncbi:MAG: hypothetical protein MUO78_00120 [candidate division Zixibacteria bacterium]|nr:hypothetical protein [candidate division Zixibacteria bacterium]